MASADVSVDGTGTKIIVSGTNGEIVQANSSEGSELKKEIPADNVVNSNEPNGSPEPAQKVKLSAEEYLEKSKINILFEELIFRTLADTPENPVKFLLSNLGTMERENWEPGESKAEHSEAVTKIFKIPSPEPDNSNAGKSNTKVTGRPGTGTATKGPTGTKVGTSHVKTTTTPPRPTGKTPSTTKSTPVRPTPAKPVIKTTPTPAKTTVPSTVKTTTTGPVRTGTVGAKTGLTGPAGKTGSSGLVTGTKTGTTAVKTAPKTGPTATATKTGAARPISAPAPSRTPAKTTAGSAGTRAPPKNVSKITSSGASRVPPKTAPARTGAKIGGAGAGAKTKVPDPVKKTVSSASSDKTDEKSEPIPKTPSPIEEAKAPTPDEPVEVVPPPPEDDGVCSKIPGSEEPAPHVMDPEELIALDDAQNNSDDENIEIAIHDSPQENLRDDSPILKPAPVMVEQAERDMTSQEYANETQTIEDELYQNRNSDDEGIEVNQETSNHTGRLRTAEEIDNPSLPNLSLDPKGYSELTQANATAEVTDRDETDEIPVEKHEIVIDSFEGEVVKEKTDELNRIDDFIEDTQPPIEMIQTDPRDVKYSEDLGIDVEERSPKGSPILEQALEPHSTTDQLITEDIDTQPQAEPDSTTDELLKRQTPSPDLIETTPDTQNDLFDNQVQNEHDTLIDPVEKETNPFIDPYQQSGLLVDQVDLQTLIAPVDDQTGPLIAPGDQQTGLLIDPGDEQSGLLVDFVDNADKESGNLVDFMPQKNLLENEPTNPTHSPDSDEVPQTQLEPEPIFPASTGDD